MYWYYHGNTREEERGGGTPESAVVIMTTTKFFSNCQSNCIHLATSACSKSLSNIQYMLEPLFAGLAYTYDLLAYSSTNLLATVQPPSLVMDPLLKVATQQGIH